MSEKLLNEACIFKCSSCPTVRLRPMEITPHQVKIEGKSALTTSTQMSVITPGVCPFSEIPPNQAGITCIPRPISGHWEKTSKHTISGKNLLIESSEFVCEASRLKGGDGRITVAMSPVMKSIQDRYLSAVLVNVGLNRDEKQRKNNADKSSFDTKDNTKHRSIKNNQIKENNKEQDKEEFYQNTQKHVKIEDLYCPYDLTKEKCGNCSYVQADDKYMRSAKREGSSKQPGVILRENYEQSFDQLAETRKGYRNICHSLAEEYEIFNKIGCGNQAHHILSTKDVYEKDKLRFVLKLANFYSYDVNEAYNCIILPAYNSKAEREKNEFQASFSQVSDFDKRSYKYYAMRMSCRQWHGGGHGDDFENSHNISCYANEVTDLVYQCMRKEKKDHCRADNKFFENDKIKFIKRLHKALDFVRNHLIAFDINPQNSMPFYVSKDAYEYAFKVENIRVLVFRKRNDGVQAYKYMFSRRLGKTFPDERGMKEFDLSNELSKKRLVSFCEQIDIAYFDISKGKVNIPFSVTHIINVDLSGMDVITYFKSNISSVEAEIIDYSCLNDETVMKRRLMELKG